MDLGLDLQKLVFAIIIMVSLLTIAVVLMQPTKNSGFIGEMSENEKLGRSSFEKFLSKTTVVLIILLFGLCILWTNIPVAV